MSSPWPVETEIIPRWMPALLYAGNIQAWGPGYRHRPWTVTSQTCPETPGVAGYRALAPGISCLYIMGSQTFSFPKALGS